MRAGNRLKRFGAVKKMCRVRSVRLLVMRVLYGGVVVRLEGKNMSVMVEGTILLSVVALKYRPNFRGRNRLD